MRKKFLYIGIILFVVGLVIALLSVAAPPVPTPGMKQLLLTANSFGYAQLPLNKTGVIGLIYNSSRRVDFYMVNSSAFGAISSAAASNASIGSVATGLEGRGVYEIYQNSSTGLFPYINSQLTTVPTYTYNLSAAMENGTYYAVFNNGGNETANVLVVFWALSTSEIQSTSFAINVYRAVSSLLILAGILVVVISLFLKEKKNEPEKMDADVEKEYERMEKKGSGRGNSKG